MTTPEERHPQTGAVQPDLRLVASSGTETDGRTQMARELERAMSQAGLGKDELSEE
ncbi:hypothetical protein [Nonomuraea sp. SYSU D8015]|uniref:hypothetical protein n=1 Tax=Nonomuraea sp. SYSU D8015 TaxID=2593644 RepID=UPI001661893A|nr:hypothetical protein [Nonomuraea sp. SYSU D8015]